MNQAGVAATISDNPDQLIIASRRKIPLFNKLAVGGVVVFIIAYGLLFGF